ncbi:hypothetical protein [Rugamonas sp.]|uniref:hypothetical protein n=1 Tax=Rugamonas sp. TaxID=1926287 RepID=UPI0025ED2CAE|nr:hypothetical protein [Rugamonas sp.]
MPTLAAIVQALGLLAALSAPARADEHSACKAAAGSYLSGVVMTPPAFAHGQFRHGVELSHTHVSLRADQDGRVYDVAMDNVFATGFQAGRTGIPPPLNTIRVNDRLQLCGQLYSKGVGIHWVHTNCGAKPTPAHPDGWVKHVHSDGTLSTNGESNTHYCPLF